NRPHRPGAWRSPFSIAAAAGVDERASFRHARGNSQPQEARAQDARSCVRRLADGPVGTCHRSSGWDRGQLLRHWTGPSLRDHLPAPGPRLPDGDCGAGAGGGHGHGGGRNAPFGCAARSFPFGVASTANQVLSLALVSAEQRASSIALRRVAGNFGLGSGATVAGFIVASASDLRAFQALYLFDGVTFVVFALVVLVGTPNPRLANAASASGRGTGFRAVARDRLFLILIAANIVLVMTGGAFFSNILAPFAEAHTPVGPGEIGVVFFINTFFIVVDQIPATRVVKRMRRTHALAATSALFAIGLLAVLLATRTSSTLTATAVLAGVAIVIALGEGAQFILLGPIVADLAPPHLLARYMSLYGLTLTARLALGPAVGGALLATSPDA